MNIATNAEVYSVTEFLTHSQAMKWVGPRIHTLDPFWQGVSKAVPCRFQVVVSSLQQSFRMKLVLHMGHYAHDQIALRTMAECSQKR